MLTLWRLWCAIVGHVGVPGPRVVSYGDHVRRLRCARCGAVLGEIVYGEVEPGP